MAKSAKQQIFDNQARDNLATLDPEVYRRIELRMGGTPEQAEAAAQWAVRANEESAKIRQENAEEESLAKAS